MVVVKGNKKVRSRSQALKLWLFQCGTWLLRQYSNNHRHSRRNQTLACIVFILIVQITMFLFFHVVYYQLPRLRRRKTMKRKIKGHYQYQYAHNYNNNNTEKSFGNRYVALGGMEGSEYVQVQRISPVIIGDDDKDNHDDVGSLFQLNAMPETESEYSEDAREAKRANRAHEPFETTNCKAMMEWQTMAYPTCNIVHELSSFSPKTIQYLDEGAFRSVWKLPRVLNQKQEQQLVLKTLVWRKNVGYREYDRHRRDAIAMSQLSFSKHIPDIYSYCSNAAVYDFSPNGNLEGHLLQLQKNRNKNEKNSQWSRSKRLRVAWQVAKALADVHSVGAMMEYSSNQLKFNTALSHTDVTSDQFLYLDGMYKLNDFNRVRFIRWNPNKQQPCTFQIGKSPGKFRSPEEYDYVGLTEKVDVFQMSNIFFFLWTGTESWDDEGQKEVPRRVLKGHRPPIPGIYLESTHPVDKAFARVLKMTQVQDPLKRATAKQVELFLRKKLETLNITQF